MFPFSATGATAARGLMIIEVLQTGDEKLETGESRSVWVGYRR